MKLSAVDVKKIEDFLDDYKNLSCLELGKKFGLNKASVSVFGTVLRRIGIEVYKNIPNAELAEFLAWKNARKIAAE